MSADSAAFGGPSILAAARRLDLRVLVPALVLSALGLCALGATRDDLVAAQVSGLVAGLVAAACVVMLPYRLVQALAWPAYILSLLLLCVVLVPGVGHGAKGAQRWIAFAGVQFQPSEIAKAAHVLVLASYIRFRRDHRTFKGLFVPFLLTFVPLLLIFLEPDLGTALMFVPCLFATLWAAGARTRHLGLVVLFAVASLPALYPALEPYQKSRLHTFVPLLDTFPGPVETPDGPPPGSDGYQVKQSVVAVAGGGVLGQGWAEGRMNTSGAVPEDWTDFIFVVHAEEWGLLGVGLLVLAWGGLLAGMAAVARDVHEPAAKLVCVGAMTSLGIQAGLNMLMTMGAAPVTGVPLPFCSYGRSAMLGAWLLVGLVLHVRAREPRTFARGDFD